MTFLARHERSLRKFLNRLALIWALVYVPAILFLAVRPDLWRDPEWLRSIPTWVPMLAVLHGLVVVAGWGLRASLSWRDARRQQAERIAAESLADLQGMPPAEFEAFVAQTLSAHGFKVWDTRFTADHGVDLQLITPDGAPAVAQVKRFKNHVGEPTVRDLFGAMTSAGADRAYLIATGGFSEPAREWVQGKPITLIDGRQLLHMHERG